MVGEEHAFLSRSQLCRSTVSGRTLWRNNVLEEIQLQVPFKIFLLRAEVEITATTTVILLVLLQATWYLEPCIICSRSAQSSTATALPCTTSKGHSTGNRKLCTRSAILCIARRWNGRTQMSNLPRSRCRQKGNACFMNRSAFSDSLSTTGCRHSRLLDSVLIMITFLVGINFACHEMLCGWPRIYQKWHPVATCCRLVPDVYFGVISFLRSHFLFLLAALCFGKENWWFYLLLNRFGFKLCFFTNLLGFSSCDLETRDS